KKNGSYDSTATVTELLEATSEADEGTDINHHQNLSICIRYCNQDTGQYIIALY
ncbi:unnamed protein product, partial [Rotaria socialis]